MSTSTVLVILGTFLASAVEGTATSNESSATTIGDTGFRVTEPACGISLLRASPTLGDDKGALTRRVKLLGL